MKKTDEQIVHGAILKQNILLKTYSFVMHNI